MKNDLPTLIFWFPENQAMLPGKVAAIFFKGKAGSLELFYRLLLAHFWMALIGTFGSSALNSTKISLPPGLSASNMDSAIS